MKIRNGFVSNSSSSSFIVRTDGNFKTVYDVGKYILNEIKFFGFNNYNAELQEIENMIDKDTPIFFDTSDGTYIRKFKDYIIVSTTQHYTPGVALNNELIDFIDIGDDYFKELEFIDSYGDDYKLEHYEDFNYYYSQFNDFLILKSGLYGVWIIEPSELCPKCQDIKKLKLKDGNVICRCKATKKYNRYLKFKNINKG